ncbi:hypothetical protein [Photorhabdus australis]|uniref:hypothetical protein n=1 Tax=Photorhabdus australis TaxID=286156 RepID=UPI00055B2540|nr:hypothetical protein [Photorhabdus australis]
MDNKNNQPTDQEILKTSRAADKIPSADNLKNRFKARSIPLETDFANLIDLAEVGRLAIGQSPSQQSKTPGAGMELTSDGKLQVKAGEGVDIDNNNRITIKSGHGIKVDSNGVNVNIDDFCEEILNKIMPKGTMLPIYGTSKPSTLPTGWKWCDGKDGRPDFNKNKFNLLSGQGSGTDTFWANNNSGDIEINVLYVYYMIKVV